MGMEPSCGFTCITFVDRAVVICGDGTGVGAVVGVQRSRCSLGSETSALCALLVGVLLHLPVLRCVCLKEIRSTRWPQLRRVV